MPATMLTQSIGKGCPLFRSKAKLREEPRLARAEAVLWIEASDSCVI